MKELLCMERVKDFFPAYRHIDEEQQKCVDVEKETAEMVFNRFMGMRSEIQARLMDVQRHAFAIGCMLKDIERDGVYKCVTSSENTYGYSSFYKFCKEVFGFSRTSVKRLIGVASEFLDVSIKSKSDMQSDESADISYGVALPYVNFSFSQLDELRGIDEKYRPRVTVKCSVRDIRHLKELYKTYVPKEGTTVEDDLAVWREIHQAERERASVKKNAIVFVPARTSDKEGPTSDPPQSSLSQGKNLPSGEEKVSDDDEFDGDDERDVLTPAQEKKIPFESVSAGLLRQLELLRESAGSYWYSFCDIVSDSLKRKIPDVYSGKQYDSVLKSSWKLRNEIMSLRDELESLKENKSTVLSGNKESPGGKLSFKNEKERRAWIDDHKKWGVWIVVPEVGKQYYRYNFINGCALIIEESTRFYQDWKSSEMHKGSMVRYSIVDDKRTLFDSDFNGGVSAIVDWLSKHSKEI